MGLVDLIQQSMSKLAQGGIITELLVIPKREFMYLQLELYDRKYIFYGNDLDATEITLTYSGGSIKIRRGEF